MKHGNRWIIVIMILAALLLVACGGQKSEETAAEEEPALVEPIEGTELNRVTLAARAAERLGIQTTQVSEQLITRERTVGGLVEAGEDASIVRVRVPLIVSDAERIAQGQSALVYTLDDDDDESGFEAFELDDIDGPGEEDDDDDFVRYYQVDNAGQQLAVGDRVSVRLNMTGSGEQRVVIPYAAVVYDLQGATWVYVSPEPLVFHRAPVTIDFIQGDLAILSDGPAVGTEVAIVGVAELYGADTGVGK
jgi:hypothetical protein